MYHHSLAFVAHMLVPNWGVAKKFPQKYWSGLQHHTLKIFALQGAAKGYH